MIERKVGKAEGWYLYVSTHAALKLMRVISVIMQDSWYAQKICMYSRIASPNGHNIRAHVVSFLIGIRLTLEYSSVVPITKPIKRSVTDNHLHPSTVHQSDCPSAPYPRSCHQPWWYRQRSCPPLSQHVSTSFITLPLSVAP